MTEDQDGKDSQSDSGGKSFVIKNKDKKPKAQRPLTKIILRRLPPTMTEEAFLDQVSPIPEHDHFYFAKPDSTLGNNLYSRAYINFVNVEDICLFRDKFDGYIFLDEKGVEYVGIVEYAPFQRTPKKKKKKDPKCGTITSDPIYQEFVENLNKEPETENQPKLEYSYPISDLNDKKVQTTPLLDYLASRKLDKRGRDERRRRENDKRKMRIERKTKEAPIKKIDDVSEDEYYIETGDNVDRKQTRTNCWYSEQKVYHKSKVKYTEFKQNLSSVHGSDEFISTDSDWDSHFPALSTKAHNTFTLKSSKFFNKKYSQDGSKKSAGDTYLKEEDVAENEVRKIKSREWEKEKPSKFKEESEKVDTKDSTVFESKSYREQRKSTTVVGEKKKLFDKEEDKKDKKEKVKESPREQKSKKYSDTRKERLKQSEPNDRQTVINKFMSSDGKLKSMNHDDIKPFTQLPQVKTDDLTKIIDGMERKMKNDESSHDSKVKKSAITSDDLSDRKDSKAEEISKIRRSSEESEDMNDEFTFQRQKSIEERGKSTDREGSEEKDRESNERRAERRIRNKDRPSMVIYQPGMGKFSKQRLGKDKDPGKPVSDSEKKDT